MAKREGKVLIAQGGGPTAVINQSPVGAVIEARKFDEVSRIYGAVGGVRGIVDEELIDLSQETSHNLERVALTLHLADDRTERNHHAAKLVFRDASLHQGLGDAS